MIASLALLFAAAPSTPPPRLCPGQGDAAASVSVPVRPRRLNELPPALLELTVMRRVDGCVRPVIVRQDVGRRRR